MSLISRRSACKALASIWVVPATGDGVRLQRRAGVSEAIEASQICLIEESAPGRRVICQLNDTGRFIWRQLAAPIKPADLSNQAAAHYGGDSAQVDTDCQEFLRRLDELGLVNVAR